MRDTEVVASIVTRDPEGLAEAYDRYAARIFSFCRGLLGDPADAAGAVQDTFVVAAAAVGELHDPSRLRPWLYAVARNECHRRVLAGRPPARRETDDRHGQADDVYDDARAQPVDLVRVAILGLDRPEQEIIELSLRHRLHGADLADTLGVPRQNVAALVSRARSQLEAELGALVVARVGRKACPDLEELVNGAGGPTAPRTSQQVNAHIAHCATCRERKRQVLGPVMRLGFVPLAPIPHAIRDRVLFLATDPAPATAARRDAIVRRAGAFEAYGFPVPLAATGSAPRRRLAPRPVIALTGAAATAVVAAVAAVLILVVPQPGRQSEAAVPANLSSPVSSAPVGGQAAQPTAPGGGGGGAQNKPASAGSQRKVPESLVNAGLQKFNALPGTKKAQAGVSLYALGATQGTSSVVKAPVSLPATKSSTPKKTPPPVKTGPTPTISPTPVTSPPPVTTPPPVTSSAPVTTPPSSDPPSSDPPSSDPPSTEAPSTPGPSASASVSELLSASVSVQS